MAKRSASNRDARGPRANKSPKGEIKAGAKNMYQFEDSRNDGLIITFEKM